jgi:hypothetical protein
MSGYSPRRSVERQSYKALCSQKHKAKEYCMNLLMDAFEQANGFSSLTADELFFNKWRMYRRRYR